MLPGLNVDVVVKMAPNSGIPSEHLILGLQSFVCSRDLSARLVTCLACSASGMKHCAVYFLASLGFDGFLQEHWPQQCRVTLRLMTGAGNR